MIRLPVLVSMLCACASAPPPVRLNGPGEVEFDTEILCSRTRSAGMFQQLVFMTETWRELAVRADNREPEAWRRIADLVEHNRSAVENSQCTDEMVANFRTSAENLTPTREGDP
jgi:hypothetical protein